MFDVSPFFSNLYVYIEIRLSVFCFVSNRYDEWVKADRIIWPVDKGGTKKKHKKKVKVSNN